MRERIVITGMGVISAIGNNASECLDALQQHRSGIASMRYLRSVHHEFPVGEVKLSCEEMIRQLEASPSCHGTSLGALSRTSLMGAIAVDEALHSARLRDCDRAALLSGTTVGDMDQIENCYDDCNHNADRCKYIATHSCGTSTEGIAECFPGQFNLVTTLSTACSSAMNAIQLGAKLIESHRAQVVVAGGSESLTRYHLNGFKSLMILDQEPCRPFDDTRAGLNLGEGAAYLVLECERHALDRGCRPLAVLSGAGNRCDAFHQTASSSNGEGAFLAMSEALETARLQPSDIDYINAHGTGTPNNDASECEALRRLFGSQVPPFSSTKPFTGHTTSASGAIEAAFCIMALEHQFLPVNLNWAKPMRDGLRPVTSATPSKAIEHIMCNAFGFGGNDSSIVISKYGRKV